MTRITFSIPEELAARAEKKAEQDRRSLSSYISMLVENDLKSVGMTSSDENAKAELLAAADEIGVPAAIQALRRTGRRKVKGVAA